MNIRAIVSQAFGEAKDKTASLGLKSGALHRERSREFVEGLRVGLASLYRGADNIKGFSKHKGAKTLDFGMNELLFDVAVLQYSIADSGKSKKKLLYVTKALWLVESELAPNKRQAIYDFNKLVIGRSENLLFVGPTLKSERDHDDYLRVLASAAVHCEGNLYLALIPRPSDWELEGTESVVSWRWAGDSKKWVEEF